MKSILRNLEIMNLMNLKIMSLMNLKSLPKNILIPLKNLINCLAVNQKPAF